MNSPITNIIKITSIIVTASALGLEAWNFYLHLHNASLPANLNSVFWIGSIILIAHGVEALIAGFKANSRNHNPINYGIYTFFVGYVGLQELFDN